MSMVCMCDGQLPCDIVREAILLHTWIKVYADGLWFLSGEGKLVSGAAKRWIHSQSDSGRQRPCICERESLLNRH